MSMQIKVIPDRAKRLEGPLRVPIQRGLLKPETPSIAVRQGRPPSPVFQLAKPASPLCLSKKIPKVVQALYRKDHKPVVGAKAE